MHWHYLRALLHTQCWRECIAERGEGKQPLPQRCAPSSEAVEQQACTQCGARDWLTDSPWTQSSLAFLRAPSSTSSSSSSRAARPAAPASCRYQYCCI